MVAARRAVSLDRVTVFGLSTIIGCCIFLQRFAFPFAGSQVSAAFVISYLVFLALVCSGRLVVRAAHLTLFLITMAWLTVTLIVSAETASALSFVYMFGIYVIYVFRLKHQTGSFGRVANIFLNMMAICAACGIAQFIMQFVLGADSVFPIDTYAPDSILFEGYNVIIPLEYESALMKSNGVFFLEPSLFSQFLGLAVIVELLRGRRLVVLALFAAAMLVSYSGTGMILVALFLPLILIRRANVGILIVGAVLGLILLTTGAGLDLDAITNRVGEFSSTESSGFARFMSPYYLIRDFLINTPTDLVFGLGPGAMVKVENDAGLRAYLAHDSTWIKLMMEYGIVSVVVFMTFIAEILFQGSRNRTLSWAVLFLYLFLGGYLLSGYMHFVIASLLVWHNRTAATGTASPGRRIPHAPAFHPVG